MGAAERTPLWRLVSDAMRRGLEESAAQAEAARYSRAQYEQASNIMEAVARIVPDHDADEGWERILFGAETRTGLDEQQSDELRRQAVRASLRSPHMAGYLRTLKKFVLGKGVQFSPQVDSKALAGELDDWWAKWARVNNWDELEDEIPIRIWRDGEVFPRRFVSMGDSMFRPSSDVLQYIGGLNLGAIPLLRGPRLPEGMVTLRLVDPECIRDPGGKVSHGIITDEDDVQTVLGYLYAKPDSTTVDEIIPATDMWHWKIRVDSDVKRGRSLLEPLLQLDKWYMDWLRYRIALNMARSAVVLVKQVDGTRAEASRLRTAQQVERQHPTNDRKVKMPKPGTTMMAAPNVSYEFKNPNLDAQDARYDGRHILLSATAAAGLAEYMMTGDAANANFASTMVAEAPAVREFEDWQDYLEPKYVAIYREVMAQAVEAGALKGITADEVRDELEIAVDWPPLVSRNELEHAKANALRHEAGVLSREGWALDDGIDWDTEKERVATEREEDIERMGPLPGPEMEPEPDDDEGDE